MVASAFEDRPDLPSLLPATLKTLRRFRGVRSAEAARRMNMPPRSYEHFESGRGRLNVDRLHDLAALLDADPFAIHAALEIRSPAFATRCAENKLMLILMMNLQDFDSQAGDAIRRLDSLDLIEAFRLFFEKLAAQALAREAAAADWLARRSGRTGTEGEGEAES